MQHAHIKKKKFCMRKAVLIFPLFLSSVLLFAGDEESVQEYSSLEKCVPFDADLFRKDVRAFHTNLEFLWWMVQEGGLQYATKQTSVSPSNTEIGAQGKYKRGEYDWHPGFRITYGFFNAPKYWDAFIVYTWFYSSGRDTSHNPPKPGRFLNGTWNQGIESPIKAKSFLWLHYHLGELKVARVFIPNPHLRLKLFGGLNAGWLDQDWRVFYKNQLSESTRIINQWKYWGIGPRIGVHFDWYWIMDFYLTGKIALGGLLGKYHNRAFEKVLPSKLALLNTSYEDYRFAYNTQFIIGYSWQKSFCRARVEAFAGYEMNHWFNLQEVYRSTLGNNDSAHEPRINTGQLTLHGLTLRFEAYF